ncbi:MAG: hypothetical protein RR397_09320 [Odoribacter sp.]
MFLKYVPADPASLNFGAMASMAETIYVNDTPNVAAVPPTFSIAVFK